jgi:multidrug efflux system membrane fusion protein
MIRDSRLIISLSLALVAGCSEEDRRISPPVSVSVAPVARETVPFELVATGTVEPLQKVAVRSQVSGILTSVKFQEGEEVRAGQALFEIDARPFRATLQQAQAVLARDQAQLANAEQEARRYEELVEKEYVTPQQYEEARTNAASLRATVQANRAAIESARLNLQNATIRAPISGRAGDLLVRAGNLVQANGDSLVVLNQIDPILVRFTVPAANLPLIRRHRSDSLQVRAQSEGGQEASRGVLSFVDNAVDSQTGTILLKGRFANADGALWPGDFVNVALEIYEERDAVVAPARAVVQGQRGSYVFVIDGKGVADMRDVQVSRTVGDRAVIERGLSGGETVVTEGQLRLTSGARVEIQNTPADGTSATQGRTS